MTKRILQPLCALCALVCTITGALAIDDSISIVSDRNATFVGQELILSIVVVTDDLDTSPVLPDADRSTRIRGYLACRRHSRHPRAAAWSPVTSHGARRDGSR